MTAVRDCWRALWISRLIVLVAGVGAVATFGVGRARSAFDPAGDNERLRLAGQPAGGPRGALGRGVVPGDRPLRLPPRTCFLRHRSASGLLPALPARCARALRHGRPADRRRRGAIAGGAGGGAVRDPPPEHAGTWPPRSPARRPPRRCGTAGGARDGARTDGVLLLRGLLGVAVSGAVGGPVLVRAPRAVGMGGGAGGAGERHAQRGAGAGGADAGALPVRAAGGPRPGLPPPAPRAPGGSTVRRAPRPARSSNAPVVAASVSSPPRRAVGGGAAGGNGRVHGLPGAGGRRRAAAVPRPGGVEPALRRPVRGRVGRRARGLRRDAPAALLPAHARVLQSGGRGSRSWTRGTT